MGAHMYMLSHALVMLCALVHELLVLSLVVILPDWNCMLFESQLFVHTSSCLA